jgi:hypothetical protein
MRRRVPSLGIPPFWNIVLNKLSLSLARARALSLSLALLFFL